MKKVYIAHPLRGDNPQANVQSATNICKEIANKGEVVPFSPLHTFGFVDVFGDQTLAMKYCFALLESCDELWLHGKWKKSEGCLMELARAKEKNIPIVYVTEG